jgi:hypothetical protein
LVRADRKECNNGVRTKEKEDKKNRWKILVSVSKNGPIWAELINLNDVTVLCIDFITTLNKAQ